MKRKKILIGVTIVIVVLGLLAYFNQDWIRQQFFKPTESTVQEGINTNEQNIEDIKVIAQNLTVPWGLAFLPDGEALVAERSGTLRRVSDNQTYQIEGVRHVGEGGLLGVVLHPDFANNKQIYLYLTTSTGSGLTNRVERYKYDNDRLSQRTLVIENIPGAPNHDGGRLAFGPDQNLYITTGDAGNEQSAQAKNSLAGKILRLTDNGEVPRDNPFGNPVYSYGHRNPQGLAWDDSGQLWSTEHGRSGLASGFDELNLIKKGANYGWPTIEGDQTRAGMEGPIVHSGADETWAPGGLTHQDGSLFFGGLRGETLYEAKLEADDRVTLKAHLRSQYGRIRTTIFGPDKLLYITTSNTDGRGSPQPSDDKIIRFNPNIFR